MDSSLNQLDLSNENSGELVRLVQQLRIRIGDVKNLKSKNGCFKRNCFCVVKLDQEEIYRTHCSTEKFSHLAFGEDFNFDIPKIFRYLSIYLYQSQKTLCNRLHHRALGKVVIARNKLCNLESDEQWFPLVPTEHKTDVQGIINLAVEWQVLSNETLLSVSIIKCQDILNFPCDSFVVVKLDDGKDVHTHKTQTIKKTTNPQFSEKFQIHICDYNDSYGKIEEKVRNRFRNMKLSVSVFQDSLTKLSNLGEVNISFDTIENGIANWYYLHLNDNDQTNLEGFNIGFLRLNFNYCQLFVLPCRFYIDLCNLLLSSINVKPITSNLVYCLGEFALNTADVAQPLVKIFLHHKKIIPLINVLAEYEIIKVTYTDVNTVFRGNSLASKCIDELMKLVGFNYLKGSIKAIMDRIISDHKSCEIDPSKICASDDLDANMSNLREYISLIFEAIVSSVEQCPIVMVEVFALLKQLANQYFPEKREVSFYVVSGFIFLRFFAPAILNPRLFGLTDLQINSSTNRTFTLISKTIQRIGNLVILRKSIPIFKEVYMVPLYEIFLTEDYITRTKEFLASISSLGRSSPKEFTEEYTILKEIMHKKSTCNRSFFRTRYKKRFFNLTNQNFSYSKFINQLPCFNLPLAELISVKKLNEDSPNLNIFIVSHSKCDLYIKANNCVQAKEWIDTLNWFIQLNSLKSSRPITNGAYGVSFTLEPVIKIDSEKELEQIFSILAQNQENIDLLTTACEHKGQNVTLWKDAAKTHSSLFQIVDSQSLQSTLCDLKNCMDYLRQVHDRYMVKINGSDIAPKDVFNV